MDLPFYHGGISRLEAEELLRNNGNDGSFLVRASESISGAYTLCLFHQGRIHQYRILPDEAGFLSTQAEAGVAERKFPDLCSLIAGYIRRGGCNGLVTALRFPVERAIDDSDQESDEDDSNSNCDLVTCELTNRFSQLDFSCIDGDFMNALRQYTERGGSRDGDDSSQTEIRRLLAYAARPVHRSLTDYMSKLELCCNLFSTNQNSPTSPSSHENETQMDEMTIEDLSKKFEEVRKKIQTVEKLANTCISDLVNKVRPQNAGASSPTTMRSQSAETSSSMKNVPRNPSMKPRSSIPEKSFNVKVIGSLMQQKAITLTIDLQGGKLFAVKPHTELLDSRNTFLHDKIEQLVKHMANNCKLDIFIEGQQKETYVFEDIRQRELFCQLAQQMKNMHSSSPTDIGTISLFIGTWNMADSQPEWNLSTWLKSQGTGKTRDHCLLQISHDIYIIGTQESALTEKEWASRLKNSLEGLFLSDFYIVVSHVLWDIRLVILARLEHKNKISHIESASVKTGIANTLGNKGAVAITFSFCGTSFCFVNCHLTSGAEKNARRIQNFKDILRCLSQKLKVHSGQFDLTKQFHHVFWFGDLNYRLDDDPHVILKKIEHKDFEPLLAKDQLLKTQREKKAFYLFDEEHILFPPTYRLEKGNGTKYVWQKFKKTGVRINVPSWCDRVLWKSYPDTYVVNTSYGCSDKILSSDHKPVFSSFNVAIATQYVSSTSPSEKDDSMRHGLKIVFGDIDAEMITTSKSTFLLEFHSLCLEAPVKSKPNMTFLQAQQKETSCRPKWSGNFLPQLEPIVADWSYLEDQHILIMVKSVEGDESYGECVLALKPVLSTFPQPFKYILTHQAVESGVIRGSIHLTAPIEGASSKLLTKQRSQRIYECVKTDHDQNLNSVENSLYQSVDSNRRTSDSRRHTTMFTGGNPAGGSAGDNSIPPPNRPCPQLPRKARNPTPDGLTVPPILPRRVTPAQRKSALPDLSTDET
ncbi:phosphatidylinositol 3,4,5-trisphosphate 5-phosphatase 2-like isoform X2 [Tubulanus polymorphus]|uniref:phosphatidylinositol 3,4,5-trisphosphate 5-phosphatase 2-like isoform X2 n=1 Tax=Tubulanus polymorphus TaxID=672921 RepID=UPI003DA65BB2